jgi:signal transduction histidine kinase
MQSDLPPVMGHRTYLDDAISQIMENACRFTPDGGEINVRTGSTNGHVLLEIQDSGPGISRDVLPRVFETFWRQDSAHSTPGFGLGLSIAQKIIEQHGGEITVDSETGQGTQVQVRLPMKRKSSE